MIIACTLVYDPSFDSLLTSDMDRQIDRQTVWSIPLFVHCNLRAWVCALMIAEIIYPRLVQ